MNNDRDRVPAREISDVDRRSPLEREPEPAPRSDVLTRTEEAAHAPLFESSEGEGFRSRWEAIQTGFVDSPREAVQQADALVADLMKRLTDVFTEERGALEQQWGRGDNVSTEDLRVALKRYRSFFERLLAV